MTFLNTFVMSLKTEFLLVFFTWQLKGSGFPACTYRETSFISLEESFARLKVLRLFLETGANPNATDCCGCIPHNVIAQHFIKFNGLAIRNSYWMLFQTLLDAGSNLNSVNSDGQTVIDELTENLSLRVILLAWPTLLTATRHWSPL